MKSFSLLIPALLATASMFGQSIIVDSILVGNIYRDYRLYVPAIYDGSKAVPLVINFHGYSSNNLEQEYYGNFKPLADTANFIIAHPNGTIDAFGNRHWGNLLPGPKADDSGFIAAMIDKLSSQYQIDQNAIYATGMSNGGNMSYLLGCDLSEKIAAIASVTGFMTAAELSSCQISHPLPVMIIHGTADAVVAYNGTSYFLPVEDLVYEWVGKNGCNNIPEILQVPNTNLADNCTAEHWIFKDGFQNSSVELYKIFGGGHSWPGAFVNLNVTNQDFSASAEIWRFFRKYRLNELMSSTEPEIWEGFDISPIPFSDQLSVDIPESIRQGDFSMYDSKGSLILQKNAVSGQLTIPTDNLLPGIYFAALRVGDKIYRQKIVK
ncbi:MAG: PHB depolymerase family esterase [Saprospiraceae bacterium]